MLGLEEKALPVACEQMPARQCNSIKQENDGDWQNMITKLPWSHKWKSASVILFLPNLSYEHKQQVAWVKGREGARWERVHTDRDRGMNRENWERQTMEKEVEWWGGHRTSMHGERERGEGGSEVGWRERLHWQIFCCECLRKKSSRLTVIIVPSSQTCCCRFLRTTPLSRRPQTYIHEPIYCWHIECARLISHQNKRLEIKRETEARERLWYVSLLRDTAPLLAASYSLSFCFSTSPSRSTHACSCCMATTC